MPNRTRFTGNLVSDNNIFSDIVNDRVGIGSTVPTAKLDVLGNVNVSGVITASSFSGTATTATNVVGGIGSLTSLTVSGISTLGVANTSLPPSNSQMSFELTNNTTLTVRVRGTDGIVRTGTITLT